MLPAEVKLARWTLPLRARGSRGTALAVVALLAVVGQLGAAGHFLLVPHRECTVHGLEHEPELPDGRGAAAELPAQASVTGAPANGDAGEHGHDPCLAALDRRSQLVGPAGPQSRPVAQSWEVPLPGPGPAAGQGPELLRLAPKGSPPV